MAQAPRHPEVNQEYSTAFEPKNQIFAATLDRRDALSLELVGDPVRVERPHEPRVGDLDPLEPPPDEHRLEARANRLHLGQLGHAASVAGALRLAS